MADPQTRQELNDAALFLRLAPALAAGVKYEMLFLPPAFEVRPARVASIQALAEQESIIGDLHVDDVIDRPDDPVGPVPEPPP